MIRMQTVAMLVLALAAPAASAAEAGTMRQGTDLMAAPYRDANVIGAVAEKVRVEIRERRGAWLQIATDGKEGWVRLQQVSVGDGSQAQRSGEGFRMLWSVKETGRSGASGIIATTGIRGMSAEELKSARPNPAGVQELERYQASDEAARREAEQAGLREQQVPFLPAPKE